jgi:hypothetical protein
LKCDLKTEVYFVPRRADFGCNYSSRLWATWGGLEMQKMKSTFRKAKAKKSEKTSSFATGAGLRLRPKSVCTTGVGLGATVSVNLCHQSGFEYPSHGFQTQGIVATRESLKVRPESTCVPGPWISEPRYGCHRSGLEVATEVDLST